MNVTMQCMWNGEIQQKDVIWQRTTCCLTAVVRHSVACADKYKMLKKAMKTLQKCNRHENGCGAASGLAMPTTKRNTYTQLLQISTLKN